MTDDPRTVADEPGRWVSDTGQIRYAWPPQGRFAELWSRVDEALTDNEKHEAIALLHLWRDSTATLVAYTDDDGELVDVEPDWEMPAKWLIADD